MSYQDILRDTLTALQFDADGINQIMSNSDSVTYGIITTILAGVASGIGSLSIISVFLSPIGFLLGAAINAGILHLLAKLFGGEGSFRDFFAVVSNAQLLLWLTIVPLIGPFLIAPLASLYLIAFTIFAIKTVYSLSVVKSILVFIIPLIIVGVIMGLLVIIFGSLLVGSLGLGALAAGA